GWKSWSFLSLKFRAQSLKSKTISKPKTLNHKPPSLIKFEIRIFGFQVSRFNRGYRYLMPGHGFATASSRVVARFHCSEGPSFFTLTGVVSGAEAIASGHCSLIVSASNICASLLEVNLEERVRNPRRFLLIRGRLSRPFAMGKCGVGIENGILEQWALIQHSTIPFFHSSTISVSTPSHDEETARSAGAGDPCRSRCHWECGRPRGCDPFKASRIAGTPAPAGGRTQ